jgi:capsular exopolysaccharide synthesis family protein
MVNLNFNTENVDLGKDFLNILIETYIERNMEEANVLANQTIEHIDRQLENISDDLGASEQQLQNLRSRRSVISVEDKSTRLFDQLQTAQTRRDEIQRRISHLTQMNDYFVLYKDSAKILAPSSLGLNDPVLNNLIQELTALNSEKQRIISQDQLRNPRLVTLDISIENLKNVIAENITFSLTTAKSEQAELNSRIEALNREFSQLPATQRELLGVERRFNLNDATYTSLLERRIHAQIIKASTLPDAKIVEYPGSRGVTWPKGTLLYGMSVILGLVIPSVYIMGKTLILNHITIKEDIKYFTQIPVISSIPAIHNAQENLVINKQQSPVAEAFFALRSNLTYYLHGETNKTILVTSSIPYEGKSFTAFNLATSFALSNHKTVLLEFDLRKHSNTLEGFNTHGLPGVSSYLINKAKLEEITIQTQLPNLDIIHSGEIPPNPIGLLSGNKTHELMEQLKQQYDFIIVDTPPYGLLTDSFMLMNYADLNLFVARLNYTRKDIFAANMEDLENKKVENVYILVNADNDDKRTYGYSKYYSISKKDRFKGFLRKKVAVY